MSVSIKLNIIMDMWMVMASVTMMIKVRMKRNDIKSNLVNATW